MADFELKCQAIYEQLSLLADIPVAEWEYFQTSFFEISIAKNKHIFTAGETVEYGYFVTAGLARFYYVDLDGNEVNKSFLGAGDFLASLASMVNGQESLFYAQALNDMQLIGFKASDYRAMFERHACWQEMGRKIAENLAIKKEGREASLLLENPEQRYRRFLSEFSRLDGQIPDYQIARYLGITAVGLSRIKTRVNLG